MASCTAALLLSFCFTACFLYSDPFSKGMSICFLCLIGFCVIVNLTSVSNAAICCTGSTDLRLFCPLAHTTQYSNGVITIPCARINLIGISGFQIVAINLPHFFACFFFYNLDPVILIHIKGIKTAFLRCISKCCELVADCRHLDGFSGFKYRELLCRSCFQVNKASAAAKCKENTKGIIPNPFPVQDTHKPACRIRLTL